MSPTVPERLHDSRIRGEVMLTLPLFTWYRPVPFIMPNLLCMVWLRPLKLENLHDSKKPNWQSPHHHWVWCRYTCHSSLNSDTHEHATRGIHEGRVARSGQCDEGIGPHLAKRGSDNITSLFVATRTNHTHPNAGLRQKVE